MKEITYRLILVTGSILLTLLLAEIGVRIYFAAASRPQEDLDVRLQRSRDMNLEHSLGRRNLMGLVQASRDPEVVYELKPGLHGTFIGQPFRINSHGMRDREYSLDKPDEVYRIVALGDSVLFGWGVGQEQPFVDLAEIALNADDTTATGGRRRVEVLNFGVPGYNTAMEVATLESKALVFAPDLVSLEWDTLNVVRLGDSGLSG